MQTSLGKTGEQLAQAEYERRGFTIIAVNEFNRKGKRVGELDFIATKDQAIVFVEVKTRSSQDGKFGGGAEAVDRFKQLKLLKAVKLFLLRHPIYQEFRPQIDVCVVNHNELDKDADSVIIIPSAVEDFS